MSPVLSVMAPKVLKRPAGAHKAGARGSVAGAKDNVEEEKPWATKRPRSLAPSEVHRVAELFLYEKAAERLSSLEELADDALACATACGIMMYSEPLAKAHATVVPVALLPSPFDASLYAEACDMAPSFHELMDRVACDGEWLRAALAETGKLDKVCQGLLDIHARVYSPFGPRVYKKDTRLHIMRNDFMLDVSAASRGAFAMKQIELNMIAASFSTHGEDLTQLHRHLLTKFVHRLDSSLGPAAVLGALFHALPTRQSAIGIAEALADAHSCYRARWPQDYDTSARLQAVLFVSDEAENNELDHRKLEMALFRHGIVSLRRSLGQLSACSPEKLLEACCSPNASAQALVVDGHEITVAYFRTGYWPCNYEPSDACWRVREAIERSEAVKCPSVPAQLAGMKKVQQLLSVPTELRRFLPEAGRAEHLERCFARMGDPSEESAEAKACIEAALADPAAWVMKPQVEGSGELLFDEDLLEALRSRSKQDLAEFVLMERLRPPITSSVVFQAPPGQRAQVHVRPSVAELGIFGVFVADGASVRSNKALGHLLRSKAQKTRQGGVFVGNAVVDAPLLVPPEQFWPAVLSSSSPAAS